MQQAVVQENALTRLEKAFKLVKNDISKRTTYPGSKKLLIESLVPSDSTETDSTKIETDINDIKN
ncbi:MAG: hypothetical protein KAI99_01865 [Cyclobacteriaceae bacterium]|nr:hypothetical protein [Cyclobacteriaceae bacterium]